jgi:hypothetical protein
MHHFPNTMYVMYLLSAEETRENQQPVASHRQIVHIMLYTSPWSRFEFTKSVVIGTDLHK